MTDSVLIQLPLWQFLALLLIPVAVFAVAVVFLRGWVRRQDASNEDPDWSVPSLSDEPGHSPFHKWDVRAKLVTMLILCFLIACLRQLPSALAAVVISLAAVWLARSEITRVLLRFLAVTGFMGMLLLVIPLSAPVHAGDTVLMVHGWAWPEFNLRGLELAATIAAKGVAITLLMEPLLSTAPLPVTLYGLSELGVPDMFGQMVLLSHRYVHVFRHEAGRMTTGMQVRGFRKRTDAATLRAVANFLGMLLVRSYERTERVFDAMRARGYTGRFPEPVQLSMQKKDLLLAAGWLAIGAGLVLCDRMIG
ncbi:MAG: cobalt ECF transporter T component CbiQ [Desulfobacterales bacterium]|jgi:cobalt/nickel transport system permease protein|nr:cobalt ECF transporter T component CbiQ [Desulfobacterales bacterium]